MPKERFLGAILFADIVGYTRLMQTDEDHASDLLEHFRKTVHSVVPAHQGQVEQFYGDGCLVTFTTATDAVYCARSLQHAFSTKKDLRVRVGLHQGEMVREGQNLFGDSINIASRIESMADPGSILVSKTIRDQVKNKTDVTLYALGAVEFKNVSEAIQVYALDEPGLVVPSKLGKKTASSPEVPKRTRSHSWTLPLVIIVGVGLLGLLATRWINGSDSPFNDGAVQSPLSAEQRDHRVLVLPFQNQTQSSELESYGQMIADWLTTGLMETEDAEVINPTNLNQTKTAGLGSADIDINTLAGAGVLIQGRYYLQEDQLFVHAQILEAKSGRVIHAIDPIQGDKDKMVEILQELSETILGFWSVRNASRFAKDPPKYEAYKKYEAVDRFFNMDEYDEVVEQELWAAYRLDTNFAAPLLKLAIMYGNGGPQSAEHLDSVITLIERSKLRLSQWEQLRLDFIKSSKSKNYLQSANLNEEMYRMDPSDHVANYNGSLNYLRVGKYQEAVDLLNRLDSAFIPASPIIDRRTNMKIEAYNRLGAYQDVIRVVGEDRGQKLLMTTAEGHLMALIRMDSLEQLDYWLDRYLGQGMHTSSGSPWDGTRLVLRICSEAFLKQESMLLEKYIGRLKSNVNGHQNADYFLGQADYMLGNYQDVIDRLQAYVQREDVSAFDRFRARSVIGAAACKLNKHDVAEKQIESIKQDMPNFFPGAESYFIACILASCGDSDQAITHLKSAIDIGGIRHFLGALSGDIFLADLHGLPQFQKLVWPG